MRVTFYQGDEEEDESPYAHMTPLELLSAKRQYDALLYRETLLDQEEYELFSAKQRALANELRRRGRCVLCGLIHQEQRDCMRVYNPGHSHEEDDEA